MPITYSITSTCRCISNPIISEGTHNKKIEHTLNKQRAIAISVFVIGLLSAASTVAVGLVLPINLITFVTFIGLASLTIGCITQSIRIFNSMKSRSSIKQDPETNSPISDSSEQTDVVRSIQDLAEKYKVETKGKPLEAIPLLKLTKLILKKTHSDHFKAKPGESNAEKEKRKKEYARDSRIASYYLTILNNKPLPQII